MPLLLLQAPVCTGHQGHSCVAGRASTQQGQPLTLLLPQLLMPGVKEDCAAVEQEQQLSLLLLSDS
jgi:hypothetical protein